MKLSIKREIEKERTIWNGDKIGKEKKFIIRHEWLKRHTGMVTRANTRSLCRTCEMVQPKYIYIYIYILYVWYPNLWYGHGVMRSSRDKVSTCQNMIARKCNYQKGKKKEKKTRGGQCNTYCWVSGEKWQKTRKAKVNVTTSSSFSSSSSFFIWFHWSALFNP